MTEQAINEELTNFIHSKFFRVIREVIIAQEKKKFQKSTTYMKLSSSEKQDAFNIYYKKWFKSISNFFLSYPSIIALSFLVKREEEIREFESEKNIVVKADYKKDDIDFSAYLPTTYTIDMQQEVEDAINELRSPKYHHRVLNYVEKKDFEKSPPPPLTLAKTKYSAFYLFGFAPDYTTKILRILYNAGLITNYETDGWNISDEAVDDIIVYLSALYDNDKILQYKRTYTDKFADRSYECIRPTIFTKEYSPTLIQNSNEFRSIDFSICPAKDIFFIYEMIFNFTIATQLKNSIYDMSALEIIVGERILYAKSDCILDNEENWEMLIGKYVKRIESNSIGMERKVSMLPSFTYDEELIPMNIYAYDYNSRRPFRYGIGRFLMQILEKFNIAKNEDQDKIVNELISSGAVEVIGNMLHPQENSMIMIAWLKQYAEILLNMEFYREWQENMKNASDGIIDYQTIIMQFDNIFEAAFNLAGVVYTEKTPSEAKKKLLQKIASKYNLKIDSTVYEDSVQIDKIIAQYPMAEPIKVGNCPKCNHNVYQYEYIKNDDTKYYFVCENGGKHGKCSFLIWDFMIEKFFGSRGIPLLSIEDRRETLKKVMSKKRGYLFTDLISKNQKKYDAKIYLEEVEDRDTKKPRWIFSMTFVNKKRR